MSNLIYIEDFEKRLYSIGKYVSKQTIGHNSVIEFDNVGYHVILFSKHYISRFKERNGAYITMIGDYREAIVYDLISEHYSFSNMELTKTLRTEEELKQMLETIKEMSEVDEETIKRYLNFDDLVSIKRTAQGYGVFSMKNEIITMITWISSGMLSENQKKLFENFIEK